MNSQTKNTLLMVMGLITILGSGVVHGIQGDRWGKSDSLQNAANRLDEIPTSFGNWTSEETEMSQQELTIAEAVGHFSRRFTNSETGEVVSVMILCGKPGPISVHPPTVCFVGAGWGLESEPDIVKLSPENNTFWNGRFARSKDGRRIVMNTKWGWGSSSSWNAYDNARMKTAGQPYLYKMYISTAVDPLVSSNGETRDQNFMNQFLPLVNETLFTESSKKS